jgi:phosphate transport system substrate-binding protein
VRSRQWLAIAATGALALGVSACGSSNNDSGSTAGGGGSSTNASSSSSSGSSTINGAGSTFAAPIYQQWGSDLRGQGTTVNYQPVGSGAGVAQLTSGTVDFAGSDPPMTDDEERAAAARGDVVHFPMALGAITASYNVSGLRSGLRLDGPTLADIFLGRITKWNDPAIAALNAGVSLPSDNITIIHRSDDSGTTRGFTSFLASASPEWRSRVGADKTVKWPVGTGARGNDGVAAAVKQTAGSIGYVEQAYALQNNFTFASVRNAAGRYVAPTLDSTSAAANGIAVPADLRLTVGGSRDPGAYPIVSQTFVITYRDLCRAGVKDAAARGVVKFLQYGLGSTGQGALRQLSYAPMPSAINQRAVAEIATLQCNGSAIAG